MNFAEQREALVLLEMAIDSIRSMRPKNAVTSVELEIEAFLEVHKEQLNDTEEDPFS